MNKYKCFICRKDFEYEGDLPEISEDEVLLCESCSETVFRLTGIKGSEVE